MTTEKRVKLKVTLANHIQGTVALSSWLEKLGISHDLQKHYRKSGWLESIGTGALKRPGEEVAWQGALYSMQVQANLPVHAGALTALSLQGFGHYVRLGKEPVYLFSSLKTGLSSICSYLCFPYAYPHRNGLFWSACNLLLTQSILWSVTR